MKMSIFLEKLYSGDQLNDDEYDFYLLLKKKAEEYELRQAERNNSSNTVSVKRRLQVY